MKYLSFLFIFLLGCATGITGNLRFQDRELLIHPDKSGLGYPYRKEVCAPRKKPWGFLGKKCTKVQTIDFYDLNKKEIRQKLINAGFTCKSKMRFKY